MKVFVSHDLPASMLQLDSVKKQLPFAMALAITNTAHAARRGLISKLEAGLDRPKPYTTRQAIQARRASKDSLSFEVGVGVQYDAPSKGTPYEKVLNHHFTGGVRPFTKFEGALRRAGLLRNGEIAVPGGAAPMDAFGNMSNGFIVKVMSILRLFSEQGYSANETQAARRKRENVRQRRRTGGGFDYEVKSSRGKRIKRNFVEIAGKAYFVSRGMSSTGPRRMSQHLPAGIWEKSGIHGSKVKPLVMFVKAGTYSKRFDFEQTVSSIVNDRWQAEFKSAMARALATAR